VIAAAIRIAVLVPVLAATMSGTGPIPRTTATTQPSTAQPSTAQPSAIRLGFPRPPPVDTRQLPRDSRPTALPGVRQSTPCARAQPGRVNTGPNLRELRQAPELAQLWKSSRGVGVRIAVIDSGVSPHPLLGNRLIDGGDYVTGGTGLADCDGHGTAVAGIAAAGTDVGSGFSGVAPMAEVLSLRQSSSSFSVPGPGGTWRAAGDIDTLARAVLRAVELGAGVINISQVVCLPAQQAATEAAPLQAAIHAAVQRNVVVIAAAGNMPSPSCPDRPDRDMVVLPAWYDDDVLAVASLGPDGAASAFSIRAPWVDVAAPGERLISLSATGPELTDAVSDIASDASATSVAVPMRGTSFAAPAVAGLAALVRARYPALTARQVMDRITATATRRGEGHNLSTGWGAVDAKAALTRTPAVLPPPTSDDADQPIGTRTLALPAPDHRKSTTPTAHWAGLLGLLTAMGATAIAVSRQRTQRTQRTRPRR